MFEFGDIVIVDEDLDHAISENGGSRLFVVQECSGKIARIAGNRYSYIVSASKLTKVPSRDRFRFEKSYEIHSAANTFMSLADYEYHIDELIKV